VTSNVYKSNNITLIQGEMFDPELFPSLADGSVQAIVTDFPYGTLNKKRNQWDRVIDYEKFWEQARRVGKLTMPTISTAQQPFTTAIIATNYTDFKYTLVWEKSKATGYLNAKKQPMRAHEDIVVFYGKQCVYNPQKVQGTPYDKGKAVRDTEHYSTQTEAIHVKNSTGLRYPRSVQYFRTAESEGKLHPTQKPVELFEWLIKTYTNPGDTILDPCMGSGTTGIAALNTGRKFVGFERDSGYYATALQRFKNWTPPLPSTT
jgi:DNA modification methylase